MDTLVRRALNTFGIWPFLMIPIYIVSGSATSMNLLSASLGKSTKMKKSSRGVREDSSSEHSLTKSKLEHTLDWGAFLNCGGTCFVWHKGRVPRGTLLKTEVDTCDGDFEPHDASRRGAFLNLFWYTLTTPYISFETMLGCSS
jgi:hypothetical protein